MKTKLWQLACLVIVAASIAAPRTASAVELSKEEAAKINQLIEELASTNNPANLISDGRRIKFSPDWDPKEQERVAKAAKSLVELGVAAFPQLIANSRDERFSFLNTSGNGAMSQMPVGSACRRIIEAQLDVFEQIGIYPRMYPSYYSTVVAGIGRPVEKVEDSLGKWWKERKNKTLVDLQIESFEWAIEQETKLLTEWTADKQREKSDARLLNQIIENNRNSLRKLRETNSPINRVMHPFRIHEGR